MTNVISTSFDQLLCALGELEKTHCVETFLKRCMHETDKFNVWHKYRFQPVSWGKYGAIGKLTLDGEKVKLDDTTLIVKTNRKPIENIKIQYKNNILKLDDSVAEIMFAAIIKILYESGACPFYVHYAGYFLKQPLMYLFSEKCSFEFSYILQRQSDGLAIVQRIPNLLMNCIFQFIYAIYIYKAYFDLIHFDTHIRNVMLKRVNGQMYNKMKWSDCKYIIFRDSRQKRAIVIKNYNYIVKLLDFGLCFANLKASLTVSSTIQMKSHINAESFVTTSSKKNTVDLMYFLLHVYQYMNYGLDQNFGSIETNFKKDRQHYSVLLNTIDTFSKHYFGTVFSEFAKLNVPDRNDEGKLLYLLKNHDVGINNALFNDRNGLMEGLLRYCEQLGYFKENNKIEGVENFSIYSHEKIEDTVFSAKNCMILDAGTASGASPVRTDECKASVQWWSVSTFDKACRSIQKFTSDCNIMFWRLENVVSRSTNNQKQIVLSTRQALQKEYAICLEKISGKIIFENDPSFSTDYVFCLGLKRLVIKNNQHLHFISDSYKKRNFLGILKDYIILFCFGNITGSISVAKACSIFKELQIQHVFECNDDVDIFLEHKNRKTRIVSGKVGNECKTIRFTVAK